MKNVVNVEVLLTSERNSTIYTVYSWYPHRHKRCGDKVHTLSQDYCRFGIFQNKRSWFERKLPKQMNNCKIKANFVDHAPFVINGQDGFQLSNYFKSQGIEINLLNMIAATLKLKIKYDASEYWAHIYENGSISGDLNLLLNSSVDILLGGYTIDPLRAKYFEYSWPYTYQSFVCFVPHTPITVGFHRIDNIFEIQIWIVIILIYISMSFFYLVSKPV
ncbi:hypothetical protein NQ314_008229 [Rhamnusium bicolor]|uniref:Solute-binding protein family 3/N-terminal domain-containing protein n=1 Tax=Rhamnusium bicolor TaxID=1586634 RepID=A0AAV8YF10_9CUCU|nr:hypothetical protein NQ314_008229 [Rhamnusium bicolor]